MSTRMSVTVTEESYSVPNNTSSVRIKVDITTEGQSWNETGNTEGYINIDGGRVASLNGKGFGKNTTTTIYNSLHTVKHNSDGAKTINVYVSFNTKLYDGTLTESKTLKLTDLPRGSKITSFNNFNVEDGVKIKISKSVSSYTDNLVLSIGNTKIKEINNYESNTDIFFYGWDILAVYKAIGTSNTSGTIKATITTKNGGTIIGSDTKTATVRTAGTVRNGNNKKRGIVWVKSNGKWHKGIALVKSGVWRRGI